MRLLVPGEEPSTKREPSVVGIAKVAGANNNENKISVNSGPRRALEYEFRTWRHCDLVVLCFSGQVGGGDVLSYLLRDCWIWSGGFRLLSDRSRRRGDVNLRL